MLELTPALLSGLPKNGPTDPIEYYRRPLIGKLFRRRINMGLSLIPALRYAKVLEVGYGAGAVLLTLAPSADELHGLELDADPEPVHGVLAARGHRATLAQGSVYELPYDDSSFDLVVCFSVFEHLSEYKKGLREISRVLRPDGSFLLGMPEVNRMMELGFRAIGFKGIEDHHITTPTQVVKAFPECGLEIASSRQLTPVPAMTLYYTWLLRKIATAERG